MRWARYAGLVGLLVGIVPLTGCFTTEFTLGKPQDARVNAAYVGTWRNVVEGAGEGVTTWAAVAATAAAGPDGPIS